MPRFLIDAQLPPALARQVCELGFPAQHVMEVGLLQASDHEIWRYALDHDLVIVSKDEDFAIRASVSQVSPPIVWIRLGNCSKVELERWCRKHWAHIASLLREGQMLVECVP